MTLTRLRVARSLQVLGALLALGAVVFAALSPYCGSTLHVQAGAVAIALDVGAILARRATVAIPVSVLKLVVIIAGAFTLVSCAPILQAQPSFLPAGTAWALLLASTVPSLLGAVMLRFSR